MQSEVNLNKFNSRALCEISLACVLKMSSMQQKCHWYLYYYVNLLISEYLSRELQSRLTHVDNKIVLFYKKFFL